MIALKMIFGIRSTEKLSFISRTIIFQETGKKMWDIWKQDTQEIINFDIP